MKIYAHRGNVYGPNPEQENCPKYLEECLIEGFSPEVDVWRIGNNWYFGHDEPTYLVDDYWISQYETVLYHAKNAAALFSLSQIEGVHYFWHESDDYTITNQGFILGYPAMQSCEKSIVHTNDKIPKVCAAILTDYAFNMREKL